MFRLKRSVSRREEVQSTVNEDEKENRTPTLQEAKEPSSSHALTVPREHYVHEPVLSESSQGTPCFAASTHLHSHSEPTGKVLRNITNMVGRPSPIAPTEDFDSLLSSIADVPSKVSSKKAPKAKDASPVNSRKRTKVNEPWSYSCDNSGVLDIVRDLKLEIGESQLLSLTSPNDLFRFLEDNGYLSAPVLKLFSKCPGLDSMNLAPTYANKINDLGMIGSSLIPARKCTVPLFGGYEQLKVLDFTNVHIVDDDLRFLIKLSKLQALGLSGTKVTDKGLKYLATHAGFKTTLQCLKLCYVECVKAAGLEQLCSSFKCLYELDIWGCDHLELVDLKGLISLKSLKKARLPAAIQTLVDERHALYHDVYRAHIGLVSSPGQVAGLTDDELRAQLTVHRKCYSDIFLAAPRDALIRRLESILVEFELQEALYRLM